MGDNLAIKILTEKITDYINHINKNAIDSKYNRRFDSKIDYVSITLSEKQFYVIKKHFKIKENWVLCRGLVIDNISYDNWHTDKITYCDRMSCYHLMIAFNDYINDFEERENYIERYYL